VGFKETLRDWRSPNERSKYWGDDQRAAFKNWEETNDPRNPLDGRQGVNERTMPKDTGFMRILCCYSS
jgi:amidase